MLNANPVGIFIDPEMDRQMVRDGYIVLPFLDQQEIEKLRALYKKWHPSHPNEFYKSYFDPRMDYKREVENITVGLFEKKMNQFFHNYEAFGGMFVVKPPLESGHFPPHQDWSFVDEKKNWSINMWCPLEDVDDSNGNIQVLKGSHQFIETIRGFNTPDIYREHWDLVEPNMISIPMKVGEAVFFFHGLLHGSTLNTTDTSRVSLGLTLIHKDTDLYFHYLNEGENGSLEQFTTTPAFYIDYAAKRGAKPEMEGSTIAFDFPTMTEEVLLSKIETVIGNEATFPKKEIETSMDESSNWWTRFWK